MVYRALVESTAFGSKAIINRFLSEGVRIDQVVALGGIAKKSPFVMQYMADALEMPIRIVSSDQTCALGAAMFAATAADVYPDIFRAMDAMNSGFDARYVPQRDLTQRYQKYLELGKTAESFTN